MSDLTPYPPRKPSWAERQEQRQEAAAVRAAQLPAKGAAARIQAAAVAANVGLVSVELLTGLEVEAVKRQGPVLDERARVVVDTYTRLVTAELSRLAIGW